MSASASGPATPDTSLTRDIGRYVRYQLRGWRGMIAAAVVLAAPALWFGWPWLVAAGLAPLLIAMAPCAVMCAVGACSMGKSCRKSETDSAESPAAEAGSGSAPAAPKPLTFSSTDSTRV